jgi:hypothetical protein
MFPHRNILNRCTNISQRDSKPSSVALLPCAGPIFSRIGRGLALYNIKSHKNVSSFLRTEEDPLWVRPHARQVSRSWTRHWDPRVSSIPIVTVWTEVSASHGSLSSAPSRKLHHMAPDPFAKQSQSEAPAARLLCLTPLPISSTNLR